MKPLNLLDENAKLGKILWYLAWPAVLEQMLLTLVNYVDTAMVGSLGHNATASIGVVMSTTWLINGLFAAIAIGFSVPVGRNIGAGNISKAKNIVKQSLFGILIFGAFITLLLQIVSPYLPIWLGADEAIRSDASAYLGIISAAYLFTLSANVCSGILRCSGDTKTPLFYNVATNIINVVLNFLFIFPSRNLTIFGKEIFVWGAGMGVKGAAIATAISVAFSGIMLFLTMFKKSFLVSVTFKDKFKFDKSVWKEMFVLGSPVAAERVTHTLGQIFMTALVTSLGTIALTANTLAITAEAITYMPAFGFSVAATTLVAQSLGANKKGLAAKYSKACIWCGIVFMAIMGVVLYFASDSLIRIFSNEADVIELGGKVLRLEAFAQPASGIAMVVTGTLRGAKDTKGPFFICLIGMWCVRIPLTYLLLKVTDLGLIAAWIGMVADLTVRGIISIILYKKGKWQNNVIVPQSAAQNDSIATA
ncbi:MAG TPA: MATE family efflux transporter [Clostridia bacterium]|nr:MATE family efflux transporter [Clostridia bacterium]